MPIPEQKIPELKGKVEPKVETELYLSFKRVYEYIDAKIRTEISTIEDKITAGTLSHEDFNGLVGVFTTPLIGGTSDSLLQSIQQTFGSQIANIILASPNGLAGAPSFRSLVVGDLPNGIPLGHLDSKIVKTDDGLTEDIIGAPNINTGKITIKDNAGNSIKLMTCA